MQVDNDMDDLALIRDFLKNRIDAATVAKIVPEATLTELGIDSLMQVELLFEFEDKTGISVPTDLPPPKTVGELLEQLKNIRSQQVTK
ncbi:MAG: acyl carrier protein [Burkholderiales bacterium]